MTPTDGLPGSRRSGPGSRNFVCTILFLDLVGYSARSVNEQAGLKEGLNTLVAQVLRGIRPDSQLSIDTGDGVALCFPGDPEEALQTALLLRALLTRRQGTSLRMRIGLHMGPVRAVHDINGRVNVVGDGINVAQRIMEFAQPGQVLVSRACFEVISRIGSDSARLFGAAGRCQDKHGRVHELYALVPEAHCLQEPRVRYGGLPPPPRPVFAQPLEQALARHIGPLASLLVEQAWASGASVADLVDRLAHHVGATAAREAFRQEARRILSDAGLSSPGAPPRR